ncbi:hypothetical protein J3E72DRAFT_273754 [Bipolaris maydis]|nr:hypothetical protein J3E72DRAFT_273754 [Bipolaris maydis]
MIVCHVGGSSQSVAVEALELADLGSQSAVVSGTPNTNFNSFINIVQQLRLDCFGVAVMTEGREVSYLIGLLSRTPSAVAHAFCCRARLLLSRTPSAVAHAFCCRKRLLLSRTPSAVAHAFCCRARLLLSRTPSAVAHAFCCRKRPLLSRTPSAVANALCCRARPLLSRTPSAVANAFCCRARLLLSRTPSAVANALCCRARLLLSQTPSAVANAAMNRQFTFSSSQELLNFVAPEITSETVNEQNRAQCQLVVRLDHLLKCHPRGRKSKLNLNFEEEWLKLCKLQPNMPYDDWWEELQKDNQAGWPDGLKTDVKCIGKAFRNLPLLWKLCQYPGLSKFFLQPHYYGKLLQFALRWQEPHVEQGHTFVSEAKEDEFGKGQQPLNDQPRQEESGNLKRPNDGESPRSKRVCLQPKQQETPEGHDITTMLVEDATSPSVSKHCQELRTLTNFGQQPVIGKAPVPTQQCFKGSKLVWNNQPQRSDDYSTKFIYLGQSDCSERLDCVIEYGWSPFSIHQFLRNEKYLVETDGVVFYHKISPHSVDKVPFKDLIDIMKRSETWKKQRLDCGGTECFVIQMRRGDPLCESDAEPDAPVFSIKCIVPREEAPEKSPVLWGQVHGEQHIRT